MPKSVEELGGESGIYADAYNDLAEDFYSIPAADVVVVTRCKDCRSCRELNRKDRVENAYAEGVLWCMNQSNGVWPDDFCSYGEPKEAAHADDHD